MKEPRQFSEQSIFEKAAECRMFLHIHGFLCESENDKCRDRVNKYAQKNKLRIKNPHPIKEGDTRN